MSHIYLIAIDLPAGLGVVWTRTYTTARVVWKAARKLASLYAGEATVTVVRV